LNGLTYCNLLLITKKVKEMKSYLLSLAQSSVRFVFLIQIQFDIVN